MGRRASFLTHNRYDPDTGCWNWTGAKGGSNGAYGVMRYMGRQHYAHRLSAHFYLGYDLRSKFLVLHRCDNPACFNPEHLFIGSQHDNLMDMSRKKRHHNLVKICCPRSHRFDRVRSDGRRYCSLCDNEGARRRYKEGK